MSRSGYSDDCDGWALIRWRGAVSSAIRGKRGQETLREILAALESLPEKRLAADSLVTADGEFCTLGALGAKRGIDLGAIDPDDREQVAKAFNIAEALAAEIMFENDESPMDTWISAWVEVCGPMKPYINHRRYVSVQNPRVAEQRWSRMHQWVSAHLKPIQQ